MERQGQKTEPVHQRSTIRCYWCGDVFSTEAALRYHLFQAIFPCRKKHQVYAQDPAATERDPAGPLGSPTTPPVPP